MPPEGAPANMPERDAEMAANYEAVAEPLTLQFIPSAFALIGGVRPGMKVLDVAAGTGGSASPPRRQGRRFLRPTYRRPWWRGCLNA
jgi:hypothetical protein